MHNCRVYWISLYMFQTVFPSTIRSSSLYIQHLVYVIQVSWLLTSKQSTNLHDIYLMLYVQTWTPDGGRKDCPKYVEWYSVNSKIVHLVGFTTEIGRNNVTLLWLNNKLLCLEYRNIGHNKCQFQNVYLFSRIYIKILSIFIDLFPHLSKDEGNIWRNIGNYFQLRTVRSLETWQTCVENFGK
jgi:hypothetical protein